MTNRDQLGRSALSSFFDGTTRVPVIWIEADQPNGPPTPAQQELLIDQLRSLASSHEATQGIDRFIFTRRMPVDIRHNSKINREQLSEQAQWVHDLNNPPGSSHTP